jgi:hypothetical protein
LELERPLADYDNDGDKDLMVTNGFYRDLGNLDYINYQAAQLSPMGSAEYKLKAKLKAIHQLESVPLQDYVFENVGKNLTFQKRSDEWGITEKGFLMALVMWTWIMMAIWKW